MDGLKVKNKSGGFVTSATARFLLYMNDWKMSLVEEYYELNEAEEVPAVWKGLHIGFYSCAACLGLWCGYTLATLRLRFDDRCYLFTTVKASSSKDANINWGSDKWCDYYQFSMVSSFIVAIIWATFFLMCGKGGKSITGLPQPWRIVWPSLIFNLVFFLIVLSTAISIQQGTDSFCGRNKFDKALFGKSLVENCEPIKWLSVKDLYLTALQLDIVVKTSWGCVVSWFILIFLSFFRIAFIVDFHMYKICVFRIDDTMHNKKEEVLRITNYEEPRKLVFGKEDDQKNKFYQNEEDFEETEAGNRKKIKIDKKSTRLHFSQSRAPLQPNAAFYVTTDIRMLSRQKRRKKPSKVLNEDFEKSKTHLGTELRKSFKIQPSFNVSQTSEYLYQYSKEFYDEENNEYQLSSCSIFQESDLDEGCNESENGSEIFPTDFQTNSCLNLKKQI